MTGRALVVSVLVLSAALLSACDAKPTTLTLVRPESPIDQAVASSLTDVFARQSLLELQLTSDTFTDERAIDALLAGNADLALVSNSMPYEDGVATVIPMYPSVLHIGQALEQDAKSLNELLRDARIFAGPEGSAPRVMLSGIQERTDPGATGIRFVDKPGVDDPPDAFVVFAPISPAILREQVKHAPPFRLIGIAPVTA